MYQNFTVKIILPLRSLLWQRKLWFWRESTADFSDLYWHLTERLQIPIAPRWDSTPDDMVDEELWWKIRLGDTYNKKPIRFRSPKSQTDDLLQCLPVLDQGDVTGWVGVFGIGGNGYLVQFDEFPSWNGICKWRSKISRFACLWKTTKTIWFYYLIYHWW